MEAEMANTERPKTPRTPKAPGEKPVRRRTTAANGTNGTHGTNGTIVPAATDVAADAIALRAYQIFCERGGGHGHDVDDWLRAETELVGAGSRSAL
jgi:hypothetical protein